MADAPLSPEEISHRSFPTSFRGFDTGEVRAYLARVADELRAAAAKEREFQLRVAAAEHRAAHPVLDQATLSRALGQEMARLLASAQEAAQEVKVKAEENAGRILREAHDHAQRVRGDAERVLAKRSAEAEKAAAAIVGGADGERATVLERAEREAAANLADMDAKGRALVLEASADRDRILADLSRRRRMVNVQVQQLRAGRDRLLDAYRVVRRTLDEVSDELERVEVEAKAAAAGDAARRHLEAPAATAVAVDAVTRDDFSGDADDGVGIEPSEVPPPPPPPPEPAPPPPPEPAPPPPPEPEPPPPPAPTLP
ncbi:MAG: DivIVA domain-containing protein, partial [Acidimicrobiales bacterium]